MNVYEIIDGVYINNHISEEYFNQLKRNFQADYLKNKNYFDRLAIHRNPIEVKNKVLQEIYDYLRKIQYRDEMRDIDIEKNSSGYVPSKIIEIWRSDIRLKSCYNAIGEYCKLRSKEFNIISIHIAEYRAMSKLARQIERSILDIEPL